MGLKLNAQLLSCKLIDLCIPMFPFLLQVLWKCVFCHVNSSTINWGGKRPAVLDQHRLRPLPVLLSPAESDMGKVYYVSKNVGLAMLVLAFCALATIIALSIAYNNERAKNHSRPGGGATDNTSMPTPFTPKEPWDHYRLPDSLVPVSYNVTLWPRLEPNADGLYIFTGRSAVVFKCVKETDHIIIHSNKLNLTGQQASLGGLGDVTAPAVRKTWFVVKTEFLVLQLHSRLSAGATYVLHTGFQGELADDLEGFYRSEYVEEGVKR